MTTIKGGQPLKFATPKDLEDKIKAYFSSVEHTQWTITGLACALDTSRTVLMNYEGRPEYVDTIKKAKQKIESEYERRAWNGAPPAMSIFALKNMGWRDQQELEHTGKEGKDLFPTPIYGGGSSKV